ncbi:MAG: DUF1616 domain-containing protein [Dehalococcoidales bacterium]|nr:MAG: DUF1616 domain-containing protein [Dehalococcoidales bacterium]
MRTKIETDLILLNLLVLFLVIVILAFPSNVMRIALGIPSVLLLPGYALVAALFPRRQSLERIQRAAFNLTMSLVVVPLIGLMLNYTWGITLESTLSSLAAFIFTMSAVAWVRRKRLPVEERFGIRFRLSIPGLEGGIWDRVFMVVLVVVVLGAGAMAGYTIANPKIGERFTDFYLQDEYGKARDFTRSVSVGQEVEVTVGIVNREHETVSYRVVALLDGVIQTTIEPIVLAHEEVWEQAVILIPEESVGEREAEFTLYAYGNVEPYRGPLRLGIEVTDD